MANNSRHISIRVKNPIFNTIKSYVVSRGSPYVWSYAGTFSRHCDIVSGYSKDSLRIILKRILK